RNLPTSPARVSLRKRPQILPESPMSAGRHRPRWGRNAPFDPLGGRRPAERNVARCGRQQAEWQWKEWDLATRVAAGKLTMREGALLLGLFRPRRVTGATGHRTGGDKLLLRGPGTTRSKL